jgi:serine/threonine-protein kinase
MSAIREGRVIASRYQIERPLARGGMGSVWVARHLQLESTLAIKFIEPELAQLPEARGRFEREARVAAQLQGPNLVQIHDYGVDDDTPYMVMEYLRGEDLCARMNREKRLSFEVTTAIVVQVARVLRRAHEAGIIHRDLKPGNVFLVRGDDDDEIVKVLDFGLAKIPQSTSADEMTKTGTLLGSPRYMSPEQARAMKTIDHRSDLWSLAVIAFRAITGALPFPGDEIADVLVKICAEPAPLPSSIDPALGPAIDRFFERAFERDPARRFQSARDFSRAFVAATAGRAPTTGSSPGLDVDDARIEPARSLPVEVTRPSAASASEASSNTTVDEVRTGARLSWIGAQDASPACANLSVLPPRSQGGPLRQGWMAGAAVAVLLMSIGLVVRGILVEPSSPPRQAPAASTIFAESGVADASAPIVIVIASVIVTADAALPPPPAPAIVAAPDPTVSPASLLPPPAGASSAAAPRATPKLPSRKQKNPILGI